MVPIDSDFINGKAVMKSPSVELVDRVLRLQTPAGQLEVDWRGKVPKFSYRVPAHNTATMDKLPADSGRPTD